MKQVSFSEAALSLQKGDVGIVPTDTLYGLVASALDREAVERVYRIRGRDEGKPCIVLIGDRADLALFGVGDPFPKVLDSLWPGKVSAILSCSDERWGYLHRGTKTIAFRLPDELELREFLRKTGPLVAPSANPQGMPPAKTISEAEIYFGVEADFFVDGGVLDGEPSTVVRLDEGGKIIVAREGAVKFLNKKL